MQHPRMMPRPHYPQGQKRRESRRAGDFGPAGKAYLRFEMAFIRRLEQAWDSPLGATVIMVMIVAASIKLASFLVQNAY